MPAPLHHARRECHHVVAGACRARHVEGAVRRGPPAPQIVVVHAWEIVVNQRIGVHHFDRSGQLGDAGGRGPVEGLVRREDQRGTQALPFAEQTVADDLVSRRCCRQHLVDPGAGVREVSS